MVWKSVKVPQLTYDAACFYAKCHDITIQETMRRFLLVWTLDFWSNPESYGCQLDKKED